jgi:PAS domain S-box-containing protein
MNIHKKIIALGAIGLLFVMTFVAFSLQNVMTSFSSITGEMELTIGKMQQVELLAKEMDAMAKAVHHYITSKDDKYRQAFTASRDTAQSMINGLEKLDLGSGDRNLVSSLHSDLALLQEKADRTFTLQDPVGKDRGRAHLLLVGIDEVLAWANKNIEQHYRDEESRQMSRLTGYLWFLKNRVFLLVLVIVLLSVGFLLAFGIFIHRKVVVPLNQLWKGATQISQGNLDYRMQFQGTSDIGQLAERFNEMAQQLRRSYTELEKKLLDRTHELAAIDSVALTLSRASNLKDMLTKSLGQVLDSLAGLDPRGGIFLLEPDGETLRLVASRGLSEEFIKKEATIRVGECLCGRAAQTGEILYAEKSCEDARHTRCRDSSEHAHIIIPIKSRGIVLGVIFLYPQRHFTLKPSDLQMLDTIGAQLGLAVENLRFYAEVKESSEKFWDLFENSRDILFTIDSSGTLTATNKAAEKFSGYRKSDLIGKSALDFLTPEGAQAVKRMLSGEGSTARQVIELEVIKRDGSRAFIEMSARKLLKNRLPRGFQVSARDMTEQKLMREKLLKAERLGAIGEVVVTVRHEINNPLTTVIGNIELLLERHGDKDGDLKMRLETILNNSLRIAEIVQKLQAIKRDKAVEYVKGVSMTDLKQE